jgi:hypothetical protein
MRVFETDEARAKSAERRRGKELRSLADKISGYAQEVHQRYLTGDVIVSERDLADQLRKRPDAVATALNLMLSEQKVQRAPFERVLEIEPVKFPTRLSLRRERLRQPSPPPSSEKNRCRVQITENAFKPPNLLEHSLESREAVECISQFAMLLRVSNRQSS